VAVAAHPLLLLMGLDLEKIKGERLKKIFLKYLLAN
jgi:hypothetical protein